LASVSETVQPGCGFFSGQGIFKVSVLWC